MKLIKGLLLGVFATAICSFAFVGTYDNIVKALSKGDAAELAKYFDNQVEVTLPAKSNSYSKAQAEVIVKSFFSENKVSGFTTKHKGDSPGGYYFVGTLQSGNSNYRTHVFIKNKNGNELINEIRFQPLQ